jgi:Asp-tRNA(Asn)/Glu-tRNA(Gln) amidotransferase A subunit family amidase
VKEIGQIGAAIGRDFSFSLLRAVAGRDETALKHALAQLEQAELVFHRGEPPEAVYSFKHALVRDAAYESLLKSRRQVLHRRIADTLRDRFQTIAETQPEVVAHHFTQAGLSEAAIEWWGKAGDRALDRSANDEAIAHLEKAISLAEGLADGPAQRLLRLRLQTTYGHALLHGRGHSQPETIAAFSRACELAAGIEDTAARFSAYYGMWMVSFARGDLALMLTVMSRPDARDWTSLPYDPRDYRVGLADGVRGLRVAFSPDLGYVKNVDPDVTAAVRKAAESFAALGAQVDEVAPGFDNPEAITTKLWFVGSMTILGNMTPEQAARTDPALRWQADEGRKVTLPDLQRLTQRRGELGSHMREFHQRYDLLLTPGVAVPAFEAKAPEEWYLALDKFLGWTPFSFPFNLTQQPAAVVPCGLTRSGLPISVQIVGPMHGDALVLRAARAYETVRPIARPPSPRRHERAIDGDLR